MCGIIGYVGSEEALPIILEGLRKLEYRGYDSAGLAIHRPFSNSEPHQVSIKKAQGKLANLERELAKVKLFGHVGIGHTRWATHGKPSDHNAHPHSFGHITLVHNGIIENHRELREALEQDGHLFASDTDTEVLAHLLFQLKKSGLDMPQALFALNKQIEGVFALAILDQEEPEAIYAMRRGPPLIIAQGGGAMFLASDPTALIHHSKTFLFLQDDQIAAIEKDRVTLYDANGRTVPPTFRASRLMEQQVERAGFKHFMHKEIMETPSAVIDGLLGRNKFQQLSPANLELNFQGLDAIRHIHIVACGSSYFAGLLAQADFERFLRIPTSIEIASEFRYRDTLTDENTLVIGISQSGETADTFAAMEKSLRAGAHCAAICNVHDSAIARLCENSVGTLYLRAGPEISVASTKAFICSMVAGKLLALALAKHLGTLAEESLQNYLAVLASVPMLLEKVLGQDQHIKELAGQFLETKRMFFIGRGGLFPVALEGALKMKELAYISAEGYPAGEMKHGPIALIDETMPIFVLFAEDQYWPKTMSNMEEVAARDGQVYCVAPASMVALQNRARAMVEVPKVDPFIAPIVTTIPLHLLAYHVAEQKGLDVDRPRNLAKSVTVE